MGPMLLFEDPQVVEVSDDEFLLDLRVVEATSPMVINLCDTRATLEGRIAV